MKLKTVEIDGQIYAEVLDGKPMFVAEDGKEVPVDAPGALATISRLNAEAKGHREGKEAAERALKDFEGLEPELARKALETVASLTDRRLVDAGELDRVRDEIRAGFEAELAAKDGRIVALQDSLAGETLAAAFARSRVIVEKFAVPADLVQARFGTQFRIEDGRVVGVDGSGGRLYSRTRPGELASFDEALEQIVEAYPDRARILKGTIAAGGGASGGGAGVSRTMTLAAFNALDARTRAARMAEPGFGLTD
ncbi:hypothetical protein QO010_000371 [Caulobacter ginsengisoli]|uniref:DUF6651 domain-containing protein n=1 Tax=Caulobacter ginsengisoli TaxID=400775 RepID=A0ABU0IKT7_9CAUL|nr:DUF6651 domain-containing protein [Caulobacter ginsengisoli]MDQ0462623.1 hypothetical protein [Caulobacter ginsengisoli]